MSVPTTGCSIGEIVAFNYNDNSDIRQWYAACSGKSYVCTSTGNASCALEQKPRDEDYWRRVGYLSMLTPKRRTLFVNRDVLGMPLEKLRNEVVLNAGVPEALDLKKQYGTKLVLLTEKELAPIRKCSNRTSAFFIMDSNGRVASASQPDGKQDLGCLPLGGMLRKGLAPAPELAGERVLFALSKSKQDLAELASTFDKKVEALLPKNETKVPKEPEPQEPAPAEAPPPEPEIEVSESVAATLAADDDARLRSKLDAAATDLLLCLQEERAVVHALVDAEGATKLSSPDIAPGDPRIGCMNSAFSLDEPLESEGELIHLIKRAEQ